MFHVVRTPTINKDCLLSIVYKLLSRDHSAHTAKRMCPNEHCTTGETPRARTRAKVVISCSTFSNAEPRFSVAMIARWQHMRIMFTQLF